MRIRIAILSALALLSSVPLEAKVKITYRIVNEDVGVPVFAIDLPDRPYTVIGEVTANVRKPTMLSRSVSQTKIYRELWERAEKLGADAVIKATYGDSHITAFSFGSTSASGIAIKFNDGPNAIPGPEK